jgi:hypothetical protein
MIRKAKHLALLQIMPCLPAWVPRAPLPEEACETWGGPGVPVQQIMRLNAKMAKNHTNTSPVSQEFGHCAEMTHCFVLASAQCTIGITLAVSPRHAQKPQGHVHACLDCTFLLAALVVQQNMRIMDAKTKIIQPFWVFTAPELQIWKFPCRR